MNAALRMSLGIVAAASLSLMGCTDDSEPDSAAERDIAAQAGSTGTEAESDPGTDNPELLPLSADLCDNPANATTE